ncbi:hypothetical protein CVT25_009567 [Psilocybe cyanescens]|uniref:Uncharacterized protein n=1 Tax=Psilocybe cyanescens TaxID=93625 RepID=A0A409XV53_PSICY|nr:hypothetical protein CVT25_009567 [Psilocybe cyanescens]
MLLNITFITEQSKFAISNGTYTGSFMPPPLPELFPAENVYELPPNKVIEVTTPGELGGSPMCFVVLLRLTTASNSFARSELDIQNQRLILE